MEGEGGGEEASASFEIPLEGLVCHQGRSGIKGLGRTGGNKTNGLKEASDVDKKDAGNICAERHPSGDEPHVA